ncbi:hypothetical protein Theam_0045 [Thermovibrio ammonificans HB-1]|uniref:Uncharacterized protein n=1 Tax=Thermovibrio ammonificans (strain DSM 15698 / JCM 12110 / HB-1) TaxID=648996 RepID=E8T314_THEA1|nr:hypothetical protein Theam_0045 [Thermovibrio ammonificans HB-1]
MDKRVKAMELTVETLRLLQEGGLLKDLVAVVKPKTLSYEEYQKRLRNNLFSFISALHQTVLECLEESEGDRATHSGRASQEE